MTRPTANQSGHISVALLIITIVGVVVSTALVAVVSSTALGIYRFQAGTTLEAAAESGLENALMSLLRDNEYAGETFTLDGKQVTVTVTGDEMNKVVTSVASWGSFQRTMTANVSVENGLPSVSDWYEEE